MLLHIEAGRNLLNKEGSGRMKGIIDRESVIPLYIQLKEILEKRIQEGMWKPGDRMPGDEELCDLFDVSRTVVRQAFKELELEGLIFRRRGRGTFIAEPRISGLGLAKSLDAFYRSMLGHGMTARMQTVEQDIVPAVHEVAVTLNVARMTPVIRIVQLCRVGEEPFFFTNSYIPYDLCRDLVLADLSQQSMYEYLEDRYGLTVSRASRDITAIPAQADDARLLKIEVGEPLLYLESISYLGDGRPLEDLRGKFRGGRMRFEVEILEIQGEETFGEVQGERR
jgi:GntR family transcriptional regulator